MNREIIVQEILQDFLNTCSNPSGLCVIKKTLTLCVTGDLAKYQSEIVGQIAEHCLELAQNPYGNYAMQVALENYPAELFTPVMESIRGKIVQLSITKYASNVVERCLEKAEPEARAMLLQELVTSANVLSKPHPTLQP